MGITRKIKKCAAALAFALMVTLLCSCMDIEIGMTFNKDGGARVVMDMVIEDETLTSMGMTAEEAVDSMMEQMNEDSDMEGWLTEPLTKTIDGDSYSGVRYYMDITAEELLVTNVLSEADEDLSIKVDKSGGNTKVTVIMKSDADGGDTDVEQARSMMSFRLRMSAPDCKIINTNGTYDKDGSVYWDLMDVTCGVTDSIEMTFEYSTGGGLLSTILIIVGAALVIAVVVIVIVKANQPKPVDLSAQYNYENQATAPVSPVETPVSPVEAPVSPVEEPTAPVEEPVSPVETPAEPTVPAKFCSDCGTKAEADAEFCKNCGKKF